MSAQDFIALIQNKQLENSLKLAKQSSIKIGNKTYTKKPLTAKKWREIVQLNQQMVDAKTEGERSDILITMREKGALYYFDIPAEVFDTHYEKIYPIIEGCILRSNMGANSDLDYDEILTKFEKFNSLENGHNKKTTTTATTTKKQQQPSTAAQQIAKE